MTFAEKVREAIKEKHLLNHPFYQEWNNGTLENKTLQEYTRQYFSHVDAFPRYISATHSLCESIEDRQVLLENLNDEERGNKNHPELWKRFGEGLGQNRDEMNHKDLYPETKHLVQKYWDLSRGSYAEGLAALYAYEYQVPEIADVKIKGLKEHYGVSDDRSLEFFEVHRVADVYHSEACERQLNSLSEKDQEKALNAAIEASDALWGFLTGIDERRTKAA